MAVRCVDDGDVTQVQPGFLGHLVQPRAGPHQHRVDEAARGRVQCAGQGLGLAGVDDGAARRRHALCQLEQLAKTGFGVEQLDTRQVRPRQAQLDGGGQHARRAAEHAHAVLVVHHAHQLDRLLGVVLVGHGSGHGQRIANAHRAAEVQRLGQVDGAGPWKFGAQQRRDERSPPHAVGDDAVEERRVGVVGVQVGRVGVTRNGGKGLDVGQRQRAQQPRAGADGQLVIGEVLDPGGLGVVVHAVALLTLVRLPD